MTDEPYYQTDVKRMKKTLVHQLHIDKDFNVFREGMFYGEHIPDMVYFYDWWGEDKDQDVFPHKYDIYYVHDRQSYVYGSSYDEICINHLDYYDDASVFKEYEDRVWVDFDLFKSIVTNLEDLRDFKQDADYFNTDMRMTVLYIIEEGYFFRATRGIYEYMYSTNFSENEDRAKCGRYISGLLAQRWKVCYDDDVKFLTLSRHFASLDIEPKHKHLAQTNYVYDCINKGNLKEAYKIANIIKESDFKIYPIIVKALNTENGEDKYDLPTGTFCFDILDVSDVFKICLFCSTPSKEGMTCKLCRVGRLE